MPMDNKRRKKWLNAGYSGKCGSAAVCTPPSSEYIRVYHLTSAEYAISNIALGRIKIARFSDLNDPFELLAANFREHQTRKVIQSFKSTYDSHTGLLCFSKDWTNPVLWSHYGEKHRGLCLGFNLRRSIMQEVSYQDTRLLAQLEKNTDPSQLPDNLQNQLLRTKFRHWEYEQEVRSFVSLKDAIQEERLYFRKFDQELSLAEVILGPKCTLSLGAVQSLVNSLYDGVITYASRPAWKSFGVVPKESTIP